ncbi:hypothetical protein LIX17_04545 [Mycobacterium avium subsp. hominissuis]|uniref:hypothetical protein n=1 Tax=Mycobacterium avium TaxID=1764 RepID=UPI001071009E|nr:hypothetical protein [Mycobacterium avium]MBG0725582.1 hypothetical protein [Mycobacterium avium]MBZ4500939.1 hypothetical protein [Mycobacterium avium subsp. hominissuis]MBZ4505279.1 hypothetical protein [Mycobacterium avium subsp. hominissuis]MBZ4510087.1 hypothetical protein [Mycobacterium avium subsp. hominissuis]MBZ4514826.1 hypothetical protein [Mycobacterium avium subsp. hominissuis]
MSRTDAHVPLWVRLARGDLDAEAQHAFDHAVCDLPERPPSRWEGWLPATRCRWTLRYTGTNICSCAMCHAGPQHRQENRNQRHRDRMALRAALGRWRSGEQSAFDDIAPPSRVYYW